MAARMEATEMRQHNMMAFLAKAVNNPAFLQQVLGSHAHPGTGAGQRITDAKGVRAPAPAACSLGNVLTVWPDCLGVAGGDCAVCCPALQLQLVRGADCEQQPGS